MFIAVRRAKRFNIKILRTNENNFYIATVSDKKRHAKKLMRKAGNLPVICEGVPPLGFTKYVPKFLPLKICENTIVDLLNEYSLTLGIIDGNYSFSLKKYLKAAKVVIIKTERQFDSFSESLGAEPMVVNDEEGLYGCDLILSFAEHGHFNCPVFGIGGLMPLPTAVEFPEQISSLIPDDFLPLDFGDALYSLCKMSAASKATASRFIDCCKILPLEVIKHSLST